MPEYIVKYDCGYGEIVDTEVCDNLEEAELLAYQLWKDAAESEASFGAVLFTKASAEEHELDYG